ncbi:MAG: hypothetical protein AAGI17_00890 [Planctomycetota bacterium]
MKLAETLWSLVQPKPKPAPTRRAAPRARSTRTYGPAAANYERVTREMLDRYGVRVRKWRTSMSGVAMLARTRDGREVRLIESPRPKGPMSAAVFLHEIGHHAIGVGAVKPRCLEELRAWEFALAAMEAEGIAVTDRVRERMDRSMRYAVAKAVRRGIKRLPAELEKYTK